MIEPYDPRPDMILGPDGKPVRVRTFSEHYVYASLLPQPQRWLHLRRLRKMMPRTFAGIRAGIAASEKDA